MPSIDLSSYEHFFDWCRRQGLTSDRHVAAAFGRTPQTIRNWKKGRSLPSVPPSHLSLACVGYEESRRRTGELVPPFPEMTVTWFDMWRRSHGLDTLEATGEAFGLTRQAIHNWHKRDRLPRWLGLACLGYEHSIARAAKD
jgi:DNA-binding XRE family transcriptional regulator